MLILGAAHACEAVEFSSSINPVGSGARATGMGGAFIAVADDATASSWNPAGLVQLEKPEISMVYSYFNRGHSYNSSTHPELAEKSQRISLNDINYASIAYPFTLFNRNLIVTLNYQRLYDMNKKVNFNLLWDLQSGDYLREHTSYRQKGYLATISPAIALQIVPDLYFGATVNIWDNIFGTCSWENSTKSSGAGMVGNPLPTPFNQTVTSANKYVFSGLNANLGLLYTLNRKYSFGFVYKTPFTASVQKETTFGSEQTYPDYPGSNTYVPAETKQEKIRIDMPMSYGFGFAYRHSDHLTLALDVYRTHWSDYAMIDSQGIKTNPISGALLEQGKPKDTTQVRLGGEYLFIGNKMVIPVRGGFFYDPEPGTNRIDDFFGFSVGSGIAIDKYTFDFSYQYRWGNRVSSDILLPGVTSDIQQHTVMTSLIYHF
jgi:long-subunit fatty acid transport protein